MLLAEDHLIVEEVAAEDGAVLPAVGRLEGQQHARQGLEPEVEVSAVLQPSWLVVLQILRAVVQSSLLAEVLINLGFDELTCGLKGNAAELLQLACDLLVEILLEQSNYGLQCLLDLVCLLSFTERQHLLDKFDHRYMLMASDDDIVGGEMNIRMGALNRRRRRR